MVQVTIHCLGMGWRDERLGGVYAGGGGVELAHCVARTRGVGVICRGQRMVGTSDSEPL